MNEISRRELLRLSALASGAALLARPTPCSTFLPGLAFADTKPSMTFPTAPRERLAVATWPFRAEITSATNEYRDRMKPGMDLERNGKMDWFFREWVYGTEMPSYRMEYSLAPEAGGKYMFTAKVSQSGVSQSFVMAVPIYFDFDGHVMRAGAVALHGNTTSDEIKVRLPKKPKRVLLNANQDVLAAGSVAKEM